MTLYEARLIRELKKGCTYRRLAEIYYPETSPYHGNQGFGQDLCVAAFSVLYPAMGMAFNVNFADQSEEFRDQNRSRIGNYAWWE